MLTKREVIKTKIKQGIYFCITKNKERTKCLGKPPVALLEGEFKNGTRLN